jgi:hypothetical protein
MKYWHPERILMLALTVLLVTTWGLAAIGWFTGSKTYYTYAFRCGVTMIIIAFLPLILFIVFEVFDRLKRK